MTLRNPMDIYLSNIAIDTKIKINASIVPVLIALRFLKPISENITAVLEPYDLNDGVFSLIQLKTRLLKLTILSL